MNPVRTPNRPTVGRLAKAHTFRLLTTVATWALIFGAFVSPGMAAVHDSRNRMSCRPSAGAVGRTAINHAEGVSGMIWVQIASAIVLLRPIIWVPFHIWRLGREHRLRSR